MPNQIPVDGNGGLVELEENVESDVSLGGNHLVNSGAGQVSHIQMGEMKVDGDGQRDPSTSLTAGMTLKVGEPHLRRDSKFLISHVRRESMPIPNSSNNQASAHGRAGRSNKYSSAGGGGGGRRWSESSQHSVNSLHNSGANRRGSIGGTIFESPYMSVAAQVVLVSPALLYAFAVVLWLFDGKDIEYARELAPLSFAALCVHLFAAGEVPWLTLWEVAHYWFHAACEVLVSNDYTRKIGGGIEGVFLNAVLMLMFWPTGWMMLRRLRVKLNHPTRTSRFPNVGESAVRSGVPLVCFSLYLMTQSLSCMVYEGVTDCALKNSGTRHLNYSLGTLYVIWMLFRHLNGINAKQVMLFRLRHHQSYAVVFAFLSTMYSLYEYAAHGIPYKVKAAELVADLVMFLCWFFSIITIVHFSPREHTPAILHLKTVIRDPTLQIETLEVAPDGAFTEEERRVISTGPLSRDGGPLGRVLRETGHEVQSPPSSHDSAGGASKIFFHQSSEFPSAGQGDNNNNNNRDHLDRGGSDHGYRVGHSNMLVVGGNKAAKEGGRKEHGVNGVNVGMNETSGFMVDQRRSESVRVRSVWMRKSMGELTGVLSDPHMARGDEEGEEVKDGKDDRLKKGPQSEEEYVHPLLKYYQIYGRIPPPSFFNTYLCEIVFFWRFMLFVLTVGYKLFLSLAAWFIMNRHWAQIFTPLSTSALVVSWLLTLGCDAKDRISNQMMNFHFWFHALSEIPDIIVWIRDGDAHQPEVIFNIIVLVVVWPWVFIAFKRLLRTLRAKFRGREEDTSVVFFWEGTFLMAVEFYLAFQAHGCLVHATPGQEDIECDNIIHANMISGLNIILIFLVVRVVLFKLGDLTLTRTLHLELRPYEVLVIVFSVMSGLVSLYFLANRETGVTLIGSVRQGLEWATMFVWIVTCLVMAHLTPAADPARAEAVAGLVVRPGTGVESSAPAGLLDEARNDRTLAMAASRRKGSTSRSFSSAAGSSPMRTRSPMSTSRRSSRNLSGDGIGEASVINQGRKVLEEGSPVGFRGNGYTSVSNGGNGVGEVMAIELMKEGGSPPLTPSGRGGGARTSKGGEGLLEEGNEGKALGGALGATDAVEVGEEGGRCCACWSSFAYWVDRRNTENNLPIFRVIYFSSTCVYFVVMLAVVAGGIDRGYSTAVVGVSFASVCSHWLISIEHPTSTLEVVHLLLHACTEAISALLWVSEGDWKQVMFTACSFFAVYPCLFYGIQALKLGLQRKFSDHLGLVKEAMKIFLRSSVLLVVLMYLAFECIGCLNMSAESDCTALLYANTQVGLSVVLGFLSFLGLIVMQDITARHFLLLSFTWPQVSVLTLSIIGVGLSIFSIASRHFTKLQEDIWEHSIEFLTLFSWYGALVILWRRRPWYDMSWGEGEDILEGVDEEDGHDWDEQPTGDMILVEEAKEFDDTDPSLLRGDADSEAFGIVPANTDLV